MNDTNEDDQVMTSKDVAEYAGCSVERVWAAFGDGTLHGRNLGGTAGWRTTKRQARAWVEGGAPGGDAPASSKGGA